MLANFKMVRVFCLTLCLSLLLAVMVLGSAMPAAAQERQQDEAARSEFIYRVNLGRADDVRLLMRQGASANQVSGEGVPVLCLAAGRIDEESVHIIQALLNAGANINSRDSKGQTALFYAARSGNLDALTYLLDSGIDMYAIDNNGDVARTVAHVSGQKDSVKAIDDYVLSQTARITNQYLEQNRDKLENKAKRQERRQAATSSGPTLAPSADKPDAAPEEATSATATASAPAIAPTDTPPVMEEKKPAEEKPAAETPAEGAAKAESPAEEKPADTAPSEAAPAEEKSAEEKPAEEAPAEGTASEEKPAEAKPAEEQAAAESAPQETPAGPTPEELQAKREQREEEIKNVIYDMSFNVCAFQYWFYCSSAKQSTDIDREELLIAIESSKTKAEGLQKKLIKEYKLSAKYVEAIVSSAQSRIYGELNEMASNRDRHEKGVGKRDDMQERCEFIARQWGVKSSGVPISDKSTAGKGKGKSDAGSKGSGGSSRAGGTGSRGNTGSSKGSKGSKGAKGSKATGGGEEPATGEIEMF